MKNTPSLRWIAGVALFLFLAPALAWWYFTASQAFIPIERFMPDRLSAALRVSHAREAWQRHWTARQGPAPEDALQRIMEALDEWPRWVKKYGEKGARIRLTLYQQTVFHALGDEAWLIFGEWGCGARPGTGQPGFVAFLRGDTSVKSRIGPLLNLAMGEYKIERSRYHGVPIYEFNDRRLSRSLAFCQVGGWICTSLRRRGEGPLPVIIDQVKSPPLPSTKSVALVALDSPEVPAVPPPALAFVGYPNLFWGHLRQFGLQRERGFSKKAEKRFSQWQLRLEGVEQATLKQSGESLFDLQLVLQGPRPAMLRDLLQDSAATTASTLSAAGQVREGNGAPSALPGHTELAQLDMALPFARMSIPLAGFAWDEALKKAKFLDALSLMARPLLSDALIPSDPTVQGRIGLAAFSSPSSMIPGVLYWRARPAGPLPGAPARIRATASSQADSATTSDSQCLWLSAMADLPAAPSPEQARWTQFEDRLWRRKPVPPMAFATLNFKNVSDQLNTVPVALFRKKTRREMRRWQTTLQGLAMSIGGIGLRLDMDGDHWVLTTETPGAAMIPGNP